MLFKIRERELNKIFVHKIFETCTCRKKILACAWSSCIHSVFYSVALIDFYQCHCKGVFTWRWGTPGRWSNPPSRGRKNKTCLQPRGAGVRFIEVDVALQLGSLSMGVPSSRLEKDEILILGLICICPLRFLVISAMRRPGMYKVLKHTCLAFELFAMNATPGRRVTPPWHVYMANCHPGWQGCPTW